MTGVPVLLQSRVDALVIGYRVRVPSALRDEINERQAFSDEARVAELNIGAFRFAMKRNRSIDRFCFENQDCRCVYDGAASANWNLEVVVRATYLATHPLPECIALAKAVARALGEVIAVRLRRFDAAADYMGFSLDRLDANRFLTTRARVDSFLVDAKDFDKVGLGSEFGEHLGANREVTGVSIARGNPLSARVYNKRAELALPGREEKRAIEEALWRRSGWTGDKPVCRCELQVRGESLDDFDLRNPDDLEERLDAVWQYGFGRWTRLVNPIRRRLRECPLDARWEPVVGTVFRHVSEPATRHRVRGGATAQQALGTALSRLASIGRLPQTATGDERAVIAGMTEDELRCWLAETISTVFEWQADDCYKQLVLAKGLPRAALTTLIKINAVRASSWSGGDDAASR
jgi:hypothetical protein